MNIKIIQKLFKQILNVLAVIKLKSYDTESSNKRVLEQICKKQKTMLSC